MSDGGCVTLDWLPVSPELPADTPVLMLLSGIAGGSGDAYVQHMVASAHASGFLPVCFNARGCAGGPVTTPRFYSASWTSDLREVVPLLRSKYPNAPLFALGWSLGANILVNYLGEEGARGERNTVDAAVSLCNPFDLQLGSAALESGLGPVYSRSMGNGLRRVFQPHASLFRGHPQVDPDAVPLCRTVREFDEAVTRRTFGFASVDEYYAKSGSHLKLPHVAVPLLCIQARDDPIAVDAAIPRAAVASNPHVALVVTPSGGHLGWIHAQGSPFGAPWGYTGVLQWLKARHQELLGDREGKGGVEEAVPEPEPLAAR